MNKKEKILRYYEAWKKMGTTPKRIANLVGTTRDYVMQVLNQKKLEEELANREPVFYPDLKEEDEIIEPDYVSYAEPDIIERDNVEYKEITLFPKVNQLADGRTELIYESKMNYES